MLEKVSSLMHNVSWLAPCKGKALLQWRHLEFYHKQTRDEGNKFHLSRGHIIHEPRKRRYSQEAVNSCRALRQRLGMDDISQSVPLPDPSRFDFSPSPGPLPHRIRLRTNQQPSLTSILLVLTCEPVTRGNLKGERRQGPENVTSRKSFRNEKKNQFIWLK